MHRHFCGMQKIDNTNQLDSNALLRVIAVTFSHFNLLAVYIRRRTIVLPFPLLSTLILPSQGGMNKNGVCLESPNRTLDKRSTSRKTNDSHSCHSKNTNVLRVHNRHAFCLYRTKKKKKKTNMPLPISYNALLVIPLHRGMIFSIADHAGKSSEDLLEKAWEDLQSIKRRKSIGMTHGHLPFFVLC